MTTPSELYETWLPPEVETGQSPPEELYGYLPLKARSDDADMDPADLSNTEPFQATRRELQDATRAVESAGFTLIAESPLGISIAGSPDAFNDLTGGEVKTRELLLHAELARRRYVTHVDITGEGQPESLGVGTVASGAAPAELVILERPRLPQAVFPSPVPPAVQKYHLRVPDEVAQLLGAAVPHRDGYDGSGVTVPMVDSGHYRHPFFLAHGYEIEQTVTLVRGTNPAKDPVGHGTGESANIFAVAPGATLRPYRASNDEGRMVASMAAFMRAKADRPDVLTNSWGGDGRYPPPGPLSLWGRIWAREIIDAVQRGIVVIFSAGNSSFALEPQTPGVLAAGGVYVDEALDLYASNYASGYASPWFRNRTVPTVCGLVGLLPRAQYLMLPVSPRCDIDVEEAQPDLGDTPDGTGQDDGWALFSGTSAAAPQLAGVAAMLLGAKNDLTPPQVIEAMSTTAIDVRAGRCHPRFDNPAQPGADLATGAGLVNTRGALEYVL
jgi:subtilisin family serine protease